MFKYSKFVSWVASEIKKRPKISLKPGMLVSFAYNIQKDDNELDFTPFYILVEAKFQYLYGVNIFQLPKKFQDQLIPLLSDNPDDNLRIAAEIRKNSIHRKAYKYYRMDNIASRVMEIKLDDLNRFS